MEVTPWHLKLEFRNIWPGGKWEISDLTTQNQEKILGHMWNRELAIRSDKMPQCTEWKPATSKPPNMTINFKLSLRNPKYKLLACLTIWIQIWTAIRTWWWIVMVHKIILKINIIFFKIPIPNTSTLLTISHKVPPHLKTISQIKICLQISNSCFYKNNTNLSNFKIKISTHPQLIFTTAIKMSIKEILPYLKM